MEETPGQARTSTLFRRLFKAPDIKDFMEENRKDMYLESFSEFISGLCVRKDEVPERVIKRGNIERSFGHQLFKGTKRPSRDTVLQLAFGFQSDTAEAQELLRRSGMSTLYPRVKRDAAILYCLHHRFTMVEAQNVLHDMKLPLIGRGKQDERCESSR